MLGQPGTTTTLMTPHSRYLSVLDDIPISSVCTARWCTWNAVLSHYLTICIYGCKLSLWGGLCNKTCLMHLEQTPTLYTLSVWKRISQTNRVQSLFCDAYNYQTTTFSINRVAWPVLADKDLQRRPYDIVFWMYRGTTDYLSSPIKGIGSGYLPFDPWILQLLLL